ncbi:probable receptor-like protein kinase At5g24010 [Magnolia sinica]|uniref:probable receptor-like protein kinase At5g24010 n=1 Tax=Magnolia sinica TaxID=86752 RepID=UPI002657E48A|nr:probable receptor-like protein kinase At5g24010 [Magnolia sinica]
MEKQLQNHMNLSLLLILLFSSLQPISSAFTPSTNYLILCGSNNSTQIDGRDFTVDSNSNSVLLSDSKISIEDPNPSPNSSPLYHTARIFTKASSYEFNIENKGHHLVRLHFYPFFHQKYNLSSAIFDVSAIGFTLLKDFSIPNKTHVLKEYIINIDTSKLVISLIPSGNSTLPMAFVNAIEVFTVPNDLISDSAKLIPPTKRNMFEGLSKQGLETVHRINVGGPNISPFNDTLWRNWIPDDGYLLLNSAAMATNYSGPIKYPSIGLSREIAPEYVYNTAREMNKLNMVTPNFNITWNFQVTVGFQYLVRMHFCDIVSPVADQLYFNVYIHNSFAYEDLHPFDLTSRTLAAPFYQDFVASPDSLGVIRISVGPSRMSSSGKINAILNGLEILKISNSAGSLDGSVSGNSNSGSGRKHISVGVVVGSVIGGVVIISLLAAVFLVVIKRRKVQKKPKETGAVWSSSQMGANSISGGSRLTDGGTVSPSFNINLGLQISFTDIKLATNNFDDNSVIGAGGFGKVYKGVLRDGTRVAVKRGGMPGSKQGFPEFQTEIMLLSSIRHRHLVSLIGYCEEQSEMILVYEFMENGPLKKHLYGSNLPCLSFKQRLEICIGAARGLHYLHTGWSQGIIHRDVKSSNILLSEDYVAKVADFGLSKLGPSFDETHVSTAVKGSFGYLDPEYFRRNQLTDKSDVYSFGVVLLEVLCARPVIDPSLSRENLAEWALLKHKKGLLEEIIDPRIADQVNSNSLRKYWETVERCLAEYGVDRPAIGDVLWNLEYVLKLQETGLQREAYEDSSSQATDIPLPTVRRVPSTTIRVDEDETTPMDSDRSEVTTSKVFSQLMTHEGR